MRKAWLWIGLTCAVGCNEVRVPEANALPPSALVPLALFNDQLSDSAYRFKADSLYMHWMLDTSAKWHIVERTPSHRTPPSRAGIGPGPEQPVLSYKMSGDDLLVRWLDESLVDRTLIMHLGRSVVLMEQCFNDQWSRCGVGFTRRLYMRADTVFQRQFHAVWTTDSLNWHNDPCNCLVTESPVQPSEIWSQLPTDVRLQIERLR
jgi:hypothetical protein